MVDSSARYILLFLSVGFSLFLVDCYKINTASVLRNSPFYLLHKDAKKIEIQSDPPRDKKLP